MNFRVATRRHAIASDANPRSTGKMNFRVATRRHALASDANPRSADGMNFRVATRRHVRTSESGSTTNCLDWLVAPRFSAAQAACFAIQPRSGDRMLPWASAHGMECVDGPQAPTGRHESTWGEFTPFRLGLWLAERSRSKRRSELL
jgi:hypothetical protein